MSVSEFNDFSMSNWSKIQWFFHDFFIFTNFKNFSSNSMIFPWSWNRSEFQWFFKSCGNPDTESGSWWWQAYAVASSTVTGNEQKPWSIRDRIINTLVNRWTRLFYTHKSPFMEDWEGIGRWNLKYFHPKVAQLFPSWNCRVAFIMNIFE